MAAANIPEHLTSGEHCRTRGRETPSSTLLARESALRSDRPFGLPLRRASATYTWPPYRSRGVSFPCSPGARVGPSRAVMCARWPYHGAQPRAPPGVRLEQPKACRMSRRPSDQPPGRSPRSTPPTPPTTPSPTRWVPWLIIGALLIGGLFFFHFGRTDTPKADLSYSQFQKAVDAGDIKTVQFNPENGKITGEFKTAQGGKKEFTSSGPN